MRKAKKYIYDLDYKPSPFTKEEVLKGIINLEVCLHLFDRKDNTLYFSCGCECEKAPTYKKITGVHFDNSQERYYTTFKSYDDFQQKLGNLAKEIVIDYAVNNFVIH